MFKKKKIDPPIQNQMFDDNEFDEKEEILAVKEEVFCEAHDEEGSWLDDDNEDDGEDFDEFEPKTQESF